jgi:putative ABC transport system permease protein
MFLANLKFILRTLWRNRFYSLLNMGGLAGGILASVLILVFVAHEFSYDRYHPESEKVYLLGANVKHDVQEYFTPSMSYKTGPKIQESVNGVSSYARLCEMYFERLLVSQADHDFYEKSLTLVDPGFFKIFYFPLVDGQSPRLLRKGQILITERLAQKYFGRVNVSGKNLKLGGKIVVQIAGVLKNPPSNSSFKYDIYANLDDYMELGANLQPTYFYPGELELGVHPGSFQTFFKIDHQAAVKAIPRIMPKLMLKNGMLKQYIKGNNFVMIPLHDWHLSFGVPLDQIKTKELYAFAGIALLILCLALLNYVSLTTARATERAREVGVRKVLGAMRQSLMGRFYGESMIIVGLAFLLGYGGAYLFRDFFFHFLDLKIDGHFFFSGTVLLPISILMIGCLGLTGIYPALLLSAFRPYEVLKGTLVSSKLSGQRVRQAITVFQFAASIALIIFGLVVQRQVKYLQGRDLGMQKEQVLMVRPSEKGLSAFQNAVEQIPSIEKTALASQILFEDGYSFAPVRSYNGKRVLNSMIITVDLGFLKLMGLKWTRRFSPTDESLFSTSIINQKLAKEMELPADFSGVDQNVQQGKRIGGILEDFYFNIFDLNAGLPRTLLHIEKNIPNAVVYMRLAKSPDMSAVIDQVESAFKKHSPGMPFEYSFLDQNFNALYKSEARLGNLFSIFTGFAVLISCLGLLGLAAYATSRRTKEIGIRKVLGASASGIVALLSVDFLKPVLVATILGSLPAWYLMGRWLEKFSYRTDLDWRIFAFAALAALLVAVFTVSLQSVKAALANPVKAIKSE